MKRQLLVVVLLFNILLSAIAQSQGNYDMEKIVSDFFLQHYEMQTSVEFIEKDTLFNIYDQSGDVYLSLAAYPVLEEESKAVLAYVLYTEDMFLALSKLKLFKPIKAFSTEAGIRFIEGEKPHSIRLIEGIYQAAYNDASTDHALKSSTMAMESQRGDVTMHGPFVTSLFGQVNCRDENGNIINVSNYYTPGNYAAGCVAITLGTILHYYQWPPIGVGNSSYDDRFGSSKGTYAANYAGRWYDWDLIKDRYHNKASSLEERQALGKVMYDASVALRTDYESTGSTASVSSIPGVVKNFFRFSYASYLDARSAGFWDEVDDNMTKAIPVSFAIESAYGLFAHAIICDGMYYANESPEDVMYHLNMGWWGTDNGWYDIKGSFNAGSYTKITAGVFNFTPIPYSNEPKDEGNDSLHVSWQFPAAENHKLQGFELQMHKGDKVWETIAEPDSGVFDYNIKIDGESAYYFRVRAITRDYTSAYSNIVVFNEQSTAIVKTLNSKDITIYPTIVDNFLRIQSERISLNLTEVQVFDLLGKKQNVEVLFESENSCEIATSTLTEGTYIVRVSLGGVKVTKRFIKKN